MRMAGAGVALAVAAGVVALSGPAPVGAATTVIDFEGVAAPTAFVETSPLRDAYAHLGVTFSGPDALSGGGVLHRNAGFNVTGHSGDSYLAFNSAILGAYPSGGAAAGPGIISFATPVRSVSMYVGSRQSGTITLEAFDGDGNVVDTTSAPSRRPAAR